MLKDGPTTLRALEQEDLPLLNAWWNDAARWGIQGGRRRITPMADTEAWFEAELEQLSPHEGRTFGIEAANGELVGTIACGPWDPRDGHCEISVYLGAAAHRQKGHGTRACRLLLDYLFGDQGINKARMLVWTENPAALACFLALGFRQEGLLRQHRYFAGRHHDFHALGLLRSEWTSP